MGTATETDRKTEREAAEKKESDQRQRPGRAQTWLVGPCCLCLSFLFHTLGRPDWDLRRREKRGVGEGMGKDGEEGERGGVG